MLARAGRVQPDERAIAEIVEACRTSQDGATFWPYLGRRPARRQAGVRAWAGADRHAAGRLQPGPGRRAPLQGAHQQRDRVRGRIANRRLDARSRAHGRAWRSRAARPDVFRRRIGGEDYVGQIEPLGSTGSRVEPVAVVLRSRTEHLKFLPPLRWQIALTGLAAVLVATLVGYGIARTVTRPLRALTATMREMAATGDLARTVPAGGRWDDEDARLLATTFGQLTGRARPLSARSRAARAALLARPAVDGGRARDPQSADDHQVGRADAAAAPISRRRGSGRQASTKKCSGSTASSPTSSTSRGRSASSLRQPISAKSAAQPRRRRGSPLTMSTVGLEIPSGGIAHRHGRRAAAGGARERAQQRPGSRARARGATGPPAPSSASGSRAGRPPTGASKSSTVDSASRPRTCRVSSSRSSRPGVAARAWASPSRGTSSKGSAGRSPSTAGMNVGTTVRIDLPETPRAPAYVKRKMTSEVILHGIDSPRRRRAEDRQALAKALDDEGHEVTATGSPREALRLIGERPFDLLVVDNLMPELSGARAHPRDRRPLGRRRAAADPDDDGPRDGRERDRSDEARRARLPAEAVRDRRVPGRRRARDRARAAPDAPRLPHHRARRAVRPLRHRRPQPRRFRRSCAPRKLVAQSRSTVLITGETGTGKELVARAIHDWSAQREMPLVRVNCAALPETLIESELFGHVRGAFTGAVGEQEGPVRAGRRRHDLPRRDRRHRADGAGQAAARAAGARVRAARLRADGARWTSASSPRPIATCASSASEGRFHEDLYYRLNVIPIAMPPLRDRREDIPLLVEHFIRRHASRAGKRIDGIAPEAMAVLTEAPWPGNVRELENTVERAVVLAPQPVIQRARRRARRRDRHRHNRRCRRSI